jgi:hypothetical protein
MKASLRYITSVRDLNIGKPVLLCKINFKRYAIFNKFTNKNV